MIATAIAAIGVATSAYGLYSSTSASGDQQRAQKGQAAANIKLSEKVTAISIREERLRKEQFIMEALNQKRQIIRAGQLARATALSRASNQGASSGSVLSGAFGQIAAQESDQLSTLRQNTDRGFAAFANNAEKLKAQNAYARQSGNFNSQLATAATNIDFGRTLFAVGSDIATNSSKTANVVNSFAGLFSNKG